MLRSVVSDVSKVSRVAKPRQIRSDSQKYPPEIELTRLARFVRLDDRIYCGSRYQMLLRLS